MICFLVNNLHAQSISNLDVANGFKDFKIGANINKYLSVINRTGNGYNTFLNTGSCCKSAWGYDVHDIVIGVSDKMLIDKICVVLENDYTIGELETMLHYIKSSFGEETKTQSIEAGQRYIIWTGKSIYFYIAISKSEKEGRYVVGLNFVDKKFFDNRNKDY